MITTTATATNNNSKENTMQKHTITRTRKAQPIIAPAHIVAGLATEGVEVKPRKIRRFLRTNIDRFPKREGGGYRFTREEAEAIISELIA